MKDDTAALRDEVRALRRRVAAVEHAFKHMFSEVSDAWDDDRFEMMMSIFFDADPSFRPPEGEAWPQGEMVDDLRSWRRAAKRLAAAGG